MLDVLRKIAFKLAILAGVPLIGTLILATEIARENQDRSKSAAANGSIEDLRDALFATSFSTVSNVSTLSGRGVGMGAIRRVCRELGGNCELESLHHRGSRLTCRLALSATPERSTTRI